jgi:DNA-binding transcriptional ArsR family regulator
VLSSIYVERDGTPRFDNHQTDFCEIPVTADAGSSIGAQGDLMASTIERTDEQHALPAVQPVGAVQQVLAALADPVRLEMVRRLAEAGEPMACSQLYAGINKSTASHHFKILREAGLTERVMVGGQTHQLLRTREVEAALPGVLESVVAAARG